MITKKIHEMLKTDSATEQDDDFKICTKDADNPPQNDELLKIHKQWKTDCISVDGIKLRAGHFPSKTHTPKANVLYLEGLADSMFNHDRLVNTLSEAGYRIIAFDYPGQGGSEGSMDQTRITGIGHAHKFITFSGML
jgi:pimeloyl-ACP methyl ester carboxylesterase